mmetsp:Transcript_101648/g.310849  ORF Transcript_101648/g.310849 Transcript_101648/m.310849 type:complete len:219 (+) Transcript_101648:219-875(+)
MTRNPAASVTLARGAMTKGGYGLSEAKSSYSAEKFASTSRSYARHMRRPAWKRFCPSPWPKVAAKSKEPTSSNDALTARAASTMLDELRTSAEPKLSVRSVNALLTTATPPSGTRCAAQTAPTASGERKMWNSHTSVASVMSKLSPWSLKPYFSASAPTSMTPSSAFDARSSRIFERSTMLRIPRFFGAPGNGFSQHVDSATPTWCSFMAAYPSVMYL